MTKKFFIIAGEPSGDLLGAKLITEIKLKFLAQNERVEFLGIGGKAMQQAGLRSIFPLSELSVMGFVEILPHIFNLLNRINQTSAEIKDWQPDYIITIDAPDFNFRVMKKLRNFKSAKKIHVVAPSVWAYREARARKLSKLYDLLLTLLPFEPPYFSKYHLKTIFIGHPIIENAPNLDLKGEVSAQFRAKHGFYAHDTLIYVTPGSRKNEVRKIFPQFIAAINILKNRVDNLSVVISATDNTRNLVEKMAKNFEIKYAVIDANEKNEALFAANFSLAKSGTNALESSLYELPMIVCYKVNFLTYILAKLLLKIRFANLINLIMDKEIIPELLQQNCEARVIADRLSAIINNKKSAQLQVEDSRVALKMLGLGTAIKPTKRAVEEILRL